MSPLDVGKAALLEAGFPELAKEVSLLRLFKPGESTAESPAVLVRASGLHLPGQPSEPLRELSKDEAVAFKRASALVKEFQRLHPEIDENDADPSITRLFEANYTRSEQM